MLIINRSYVKLCWLSLDSFFDAIGYLFDTFVNISPADWEFATVYWESEKIMTNNGEASPSQSCLSQSSYNKT